jgi:hypothetical protein
MILEAVITNTSKTGKTDVLGSSAYFYRCFIGAISIIIIWLKWLNFGQ